MSSEIISVMETASDEIIKKLQQGERQEAALAKINTEHETEKERNNPFRLVSYSGKEIAEMEIHESPYILYPWLREGNVAMISAKAGIGKTYLSLEISRAIATGTSIFDSRWDARCVKGVLYIDGEMSETIMKKRLGNFGLLDNENFRLINPDFSPDSLSININRIEWQNAIFKEIDKQNSKVLILDNVASLYRTDKTNASESWLNMQDFLLTLRKNKIAVILIDHQGKSNDGTARGTSAKEDILDTGIALKRPENYNTEQGCRFEVHFRKTRDFFGEQAKPFEVTLNGQEWITAEIAQTDRTSSVRPIDQEKRDSIIANFKAGLTAKQIIENGVASKNFVYNTIKEYKAEQEAATDPNWGNVGCYIQ